MTGPDPEISPLEEQEFIRGKLFDGNKSTLRRYADLVVGVDASYRDLLIHEVITTLFGRLPGALGFGLRRIFYPRLFRHCGRGVIFGCDLVIRNGRSISIGDQTILDDGCVIDGRGAGHEGVVIGARVILSRDVMVQAKIGPVHIGDDSDIGSSSIVHSQGGTYIGKEVVIGGGAKISGGVFQIDADDTPQDADGDQAQRAQARFTRGPIRIHDRCLFGMGCIVLDGAEIGEAAVIGAGSVVNRSIPPYSVAAGNPARVLRTRRM
ncbi:MAG: acyltransferase [Geminicoccaceae bacterium]|nr:acyltransferase [Geminicoccaceae bacterium]